MTDFTQSRRRDLSVAYANCLRGRERRRNLFVIIGTSGMVLATMALGLRF